jgi:hypothetical protein
LVTLLDRQVMDGPIAPQRCRKLVELLGGNANAGMRVAKLPRPEHRLVLAVQHFQ